jgi:hypothetical protein
MVLSRNYAPLTRFQLLRSAGRRCILPFACLPAHAALLHELALYICADEPGMHGERIVANALPTLQSTASIAGSAAAWPVALRSARLWRPCVLAVNVPSSRLPP